MASLLLFAQGLSVQDSATPAAGWLLITLHSVILVISLFLILLVLIQRGKGGGLVGMLGGSGGSSAFGSRAGDQFTKVTIFAAAIWMLLIMITLKLGPQPVPVGPPQIGANQPALPPDGSTDPGTDGNQN